MTPGSSPASAEPSAPGAVARALLAAPALLLAMAPAVAAQHAGEPAVAITLGDEVLVSDAPDGGALRVEPSAALSGDVVIVAWNDSHGGRHGVRAGTSAAWAISRDRGRTFEFGGFLPPSGPDLPPAGADTWLAADARGRFYLQVLSWYDDRHELRLFTMDPARDPAWEERPAVAVSDRAQGEPVLDRPAMHVSPDGAVTIAYRQGDHLRIRRSPDGGRSWLDPVRVAPEGAPRVRVPGIAAVGDDVLACWAGGEGMDGPEELWCAASTDGTRSFPSSRRLLRTERPLPAPSGYRIGPGPYHLGPNVVWVATDRERRAAHVVFTEPTDEGSRILHWTYDLSAGRWSGPTPVTGDRDPGLKLMPSVASAGGRPHVLYYAERTAPDGSVQEGVMEVRLATRTEAGWRETRLTSVPTDWNAMPPDAEHAPVQRNAGDYITLAADGDRLFATWTDGRTGEPRIWGRPAVVGVSDR